jgi:hypothetical protein
MNTNTQYQENWVVPEFKGTTCVLKSWRIEWAQTLSKHANNPNIAANLPDHFPHPFTEQEAVNYINGKPTLNFKKKIPALFNRNEHAIGILNDNNKRRRYLAICIEDGEKIEPIGTVCGVALDGGKKHVSSLPRGIIILINVLFAEGRIGLLAQRTILGQRNCLGCVQNDGQILLFR